MFLRLAVLAHTRADQEEPQQCSPGGLRVALATAQAVLWPMGTGSVGSCGQHWELPRALGCSPASTGAAGVGRAGNAQGRSQLAAAMAECCSWQDPSCSGAEAPGLQWFFGSPALWWWSVAPQAVDEHQLGINCLGINL